MTDEKKLAKQLSKKSRKLLKEAMASIDFTSKVVPIKDEEDGDIYYCIEKGSGLKRQHVHIVDDALVAVSLLYSSAGAKNTSKYYKKVSRMVFYAFYELESREILEQEIKYVKGVDNEDY